MTKTTVSIAAAVTALTLGLLGISPAASARATTPVPATYKLAAGSYALAIGLHAVWAVNADEVHHAQLYRIDPNSQVRKRVTTLPFPAGGIAVAFGSVWVSDYFGNAVWRLASNGHVQAVISVGLQPQWIDAAFGSIWVANHHSSSMTRIDAATNTVLDTVQVGAPDTFRDGPLDITHDASRVYVDSANLFDLQSVDPATDAVSTPTQPSGDDLFCGKIEATSGYVWSVDACSAATYQLDPNGSVAQVIPGTGVPLSLTTSNGDVWIGDDTTVDPDTGQGSDAVLDEFDGVTAAPIRTIAIGGDASDLTSGYGALWVYDALANTIRRIDR